MYSSLRSLEIQTTYHCSTQEMSPTVHAGDLQAVLAQRGPYPPLFSSWKWRIIQLKFMLLK